MNIPCLPVVFVLLLSSAVASSAEERPNVLFIMTDDLNCNLGAYGHPLVKTPNIDRLAREGLLFENAFCNFPLCGPSRASFMTGLYPVQNGVTRLRRLFRDYVPDAITLTQHFMNAGYVAARVGKIYHYDNPKGVGTNSHDDPASWMTRISPSGRDKDEEDKIFSLVPGSFGATLSWLAADGTDEEQTDGLVATESIKLLQQYAEGDQSFFLAVGFYKPHTPYVAPRRYFDLYDPKNIEVPRFPAEYLDTLPEPARESLTAFRTQIDLPEDTARKAIHAYYATISFVDAQIGRVLDALKPLGLEDNTIIVFSSDHGYHMGEHGHYQKKTLYENADRVPLIITAPGMKARGQRSRALVEMIDFYRTLSELANLSEPPDYVQGMSLADHLDDPHLPGRGAALTQINGGFTIRTSRYRYTKWIDIKVENIELYDRLNDAAEMVNLATDAHYQDVIKDLDYLWKKRVAAATHHPASLGFTEPDPKDNGYSLAEMILKDPAN